MEKLRVFSVARRVRTGLGVGLVLGLVVLLLLSLTVALAGCGGVECGKGTVEKDGICVVATALECGPGFKSDGKECIPENEWIKFYCDPDTAKIEGGRCVGTGTVGPTKGCTDMAKKCQQPTASDICITGQIFHADELMAKWAGVNDSPTPLEATTTSGAQVMIYDPLEFVANPNAKPLAETAIEENGCFVVDAVTIPFAGFFAVGVREPGGGQTKWAFAALGLTPASGKNSLDLEVPAVSMDLSKKWGDDFRTDGSMILLFRNKLTGAAMEGIQPTFDGDPPGADGNWPAMELTYFSDDPSKEPYFDAKAKTDKLITKSGAVMVRKAQVQTFSGTKSGCLIEATLGGSSPNPYFFTDREVEGCQ